MKNEVVIDGMTFTRAKLTEIREKLDKAQKEMDAPDPIANLTRVRERKMILDHTGIVITGIAQNKYVKGTGMFQNPYDYPYTVIMLNGAGATYRTESQLLESWEVVS